MSRTLLKTLVGMGAVLLAACGTSGAPPAETGTAVRFQASNLEPLAKGHFEGWVISGDSKVSFGSFNVNEQKQLVDLSGKPVNSFRTKTPVSRADAFAITIEPDNKVGDQPSPTVILFGKAASGRADLSFQAIDFEALSGGYMLAVPTADGYPQTTGVWFVDPRSGSPAAGLRLPDAPTGWKYEGWVVYQDHPISTGRFAKANGPDEFSGFSGTQHPAPPFPGEDLIQNLPFGLKSPLALNNGSTKVVVTIEPDQNGIDPTGPGPFQLKPLLATVAAGAADHIYFQLALSKATLPAGSANLG